MLTCPSHLIDALSGGDLIPHAPRLYVLINIDKHGQALIVMIDGLSPNKCLLLKRHI